MIISYGTKKYFEVELAKAKFKEAAIKKHVKDCLTKGDNADDAEVLQCYSEMIEEAEKATKGAQERYDESTKKEETDNG